MLPIDFDLNRKYCIAQALSMARERGTQKMNWRMECCRRWSRWNLEPHRMMCTEESARKIIFSRFSRAEIFWLVCAVRSRSSFSFFSFSLLAFLRVPDGTWISAARWRRNIKKFIILMLLLFACTALLVCVVLSIYLFGIHNAFESPSDQRAKDSRLWSQTHLMIILDHLSRDSFSAHPLKDFSARFAALPRATRTIDHVHCAILPSWSRIKLLIQTQFAEILFGLIDKTKNVPRKFIGGIWTVVPNFCLKILKNLIKRRRKLLQPGAKMLTSPAFEGSKLNLFALNHKSSGPTRIGSNDPDEVESHKSQIELIATT